MNPWLQLVAGNILVASLIGGLAWQVGRSGRRAPLAHILWVAFFVKLITPPLVLLPIHVPENWLPATAASYTTSFPYHGLDRPRHQSASGVLLGPAEFPAANTTSDLNSNTWFWTRSVGFWTILGLFWMFGFVLVLTRGLIRFVRFHRLLTREGSDDDEASAFVQTLLHPGGQTNARTSTGPRVLRVPIRVSPMLFGFGRRPAIVCPDQLWQSLSDNDRHAFLAHEAAHYYRRDHWVRWLEWIVTAAYWWFPGVYFARRQLERNEEACCDAWAVRKLGSPPRQYAEALLRVVDFISEHGVGIPRLASGMRPTESLEQRLRQIMQGGGVDHSSATFRCCAGAACFALWLLHPVPLAKNPLLAELVPQVSQQVVPLASVDVTRSPVLKMKTDLYLPDPPRGFWNHTPHQQWASFSLTLPGARLVAESNRGISIEVPGRESLRFSADQLSAVVEIPSTQRVVIGDRDGLLRLWDLAAGTPVSLIGRHATGVSSITYHEKAGLVSGDDGGSVIGWDLQSGQVLATWSGTSPHVQSVRHSSDGSSLAILTGRWSELDAFQDVHFVDGRTMGSLHSMTLSGNAAVVLQSPEFGWVVVDWSGIVSLLDTLRPVASIAKHHVSALVLSPQTSLDSLIAESLALQVSIPTTASGP